jgi:glutaminyl-tRNA synthetase
MAVLNPVKLVITNYPEGKTEILHLENNPEEANSGTHKVPFSRELYIEQEDFKEDGGKNFFRLSLGNEVRLKSAYIIKGEAVIKDESGKILEIHCTYDPETRSGSGTEASERKVKGTLHWISIAQAIKAEVREYDRLFLDEAPDSHEEKGFMEFINPNSLHVIQEAYCEPFLANATLNDKFQFQRLGYFTLDPDSKDEKLVFNKTVGLKDTWAKQNTQQTPAQNQPKPQPAVQPQGQKKALNEIQQIGKKLTNLSGDKLETAMNSIREFAEEITYEELEPLFETASKKTGTRIATMLALGVLLKKGQVKNQAIADFIESGKADENEILRAEAEKLD